MAMKLNCSRTKKSSMRLNARFSRVSSYDCSMFQPIISSGECKLRMQSLTKYKHRQMTPLSPLIPSSSYLEWKPGFFSLPLSTSSSLLGNGMPMRGLKHGTTQGPWPSFDRKEDVLCLFITISQPMVDLSKLSASTHLIECLNPLIY